MSVFRVQKTTNYTVMSNYHLKETKMSLKAVGLLSKMLSLPEDWDYSISGLAAICADGESAIKSTLKELQQFGYLEVVKIYPSESKSGRIEYEYIVYEIPNYLQKQEPDFGGLVSKKQSTKNNSKKDTQSTKYQQEEHDYVNTSQINEQEGKKQELEIQELENQELENHTQLNTNNKILKNKILKTPPKGDTSLIKTQSKKTKKAKDMKTINNMLNIFSDDEDIQNNLKKYLAIRAKKGLTPEQWQIILADLKQYTKNKQDMISQIQNAIAGGYMQIIPSWQKTSPQSKFDNTASHKDKSLAEMTPEQRKQFKETLVKDSTGKEIVF